MTCNRYWNYCKKARFQMVWVEALKLWVFAGLKVDLLRKWEK